MVTYSPLVDFLLKFIPFSSVFVTLMFLITNTELKFSLYYNRKVFFPYVLGSSFSY